MCRVQNRGRYSWLVIVLGWVLVNSSSGTRAADKPRELPESASDGAQLAPVDPLLAIVENAIDVTSRRYLDANVHTPWQIIHAYLGMRDKFKLRLNGEKVDGLTWISSGPVFKGQQWFEKTPYGGRAQPFNGTPYDFEGHPNQFIGYMTLCNLPLDHKFKTKGEETITVADMIRNAQMEVRTGDDNTWTLWALAHYLGPDARWTNRYGEEWSVERLVQLEIASQVTRAPCGGTHGLFALAYARNGYIETNRPLRGVWLEADQKVRRYIEEARAYQNPDGFFSSNHFRGPGYSHEFSARISAAGHILEFLMSALPQNRLNEEWVRRGIEAVAKDLLEHRKDAAECGGLYHSLDSLVIYRDRVRLKSETVRTAAKPADANAVASPAPASPSTANPTAGTEDKKNEPAPAAAVPRFVPSPLFVPQPRTVGSKQ